MTARSGMGEEPGLESFEDFTELKATIVNTAAEQADWYGDTSQRLN